MNDPRYYHFDPSDSDQYYSDNWHDNKPSYVRIEEPNEMQRRLLELVSDALPDEWTFDQIRGSVEANPRYAGIVFIFNRNRYNHDTDISTRIRNRDEALSELDFTNVVISPRYRPFTLKPSNIDAVTMPQYKCKRVDASYVQSHQGQGEWGYLFNSLFVAIDLEDRKAKLEEMKRGYESLGQRVERLGREIETG